MVELSTRGNLKRLIFGLFLMVFFLQGYSLALFDDYEWTSGSYELGVGKEYALVSELITRNDVGVTIYSGGAVHDYWMYDDSTLLIVNGGGSVTTLNMYDNTQATFYDMSNAGGDIYIDPASTAKVILHAYDIIYYDFGPYDRLEGYWVANDMWFSIDLFGEGAYSHVEIVPEPATLALLALGGLSLIRRRRK